MSSSSSTSCGPGRASARARVAWCRPVFSLGACVTVAKHGAAPEGVLGAGSDPRSCPHTPQPQGELGRHLLILGGWEGRAPTLALCMVKRSTPVPATLMLETSDRKLKEMVTWEDGEEAGGSHRFAQTCKVCRATSAGGALAPAGLALLPGVPLVVSVWCKDGKSPLDRRYRHT